MHSERFASLALFALIGCGNSGGHVALGAGPQSGSGAVGGGVAAGGSSGTHASGGTGAGQASGGSIATGGTGGGAQGGSVSAGGAANGASSGSGGSGNGDAAGSDGGFTEPTSSWSAVRKIKNVLTGLAPTDDELATARQGTDGLKQLIDAWSATPEFESKLVTFFADAFQQSSLSVLDYEFQLRKRPGAFDLPYDIFGDDAYPRLFQNMKESFARTALELVKEGKPFTDVLTTNRFMLTTALKSLYLQIEMPYDIHTLTFQFNHGMRPAIEDSLDPNSPNYMVFGYAAPTTSSGKKFSGTCAGDATKISTYPGNTYLFQVLLGVAPRDSDNNSAGTTALGCMEHAILPYFTASDLSDWTLVTIANDGGAALRAFDLPAVRAATTLSSKLPRVSFFTTPAFLAVWNTNDSNQHRVTANQALLGALGQGFLNADDVVVTPPTLVAVNGDHASSGACYACHKALDPMRQFWATSYDYNDRTDGKGKGGGAPSFGFGDVAADGKTLVDFGSLLAEVGDQQVAASPVNRFALAMTQKLCFFANSARCAETDPEMRRVALAFQNSSFDFKTLVRELFASPLVTAADTTLTFQTDGVTVSVARRNQLCDALSNRLGVPDVCEIAMPTPTDVTTPMNRLAGAMAADAFSRGSEFPVTPTDPNLFYRAASELVCEAVAAKVVDPSTGTAVYQSSDPTGAIEDMVSKLMGYAPSDPNHAPAAQILTDHFNAARGTQGTTATSALRSTFSAACQAPSSVGIGL